MGIIAWIIFDLIAGIIAKLIMPGRDGGGSYSRSGHIPPPAKRIRFS